MARGDTNEPALGLKSPKLQFYFPFLHLDRSPIQTRTGVNVLTLQLLSL